MNVKDVMTSPVQYCSVDTNLAAAAGMMWDSDCGVLPVVDRSGKVIGMITDRDICIAVATKSRLASEISVWETITGKVVSVAPEDEVHDALKAMAANRVRRLPVVDQDGILCGVVTLNDLVLQAGAGRGKAPDISHADIVDTLLAISRHRILQAA